MACLSGLVCAKSMSLDLLPVWLSVYCLSTALLYWKYSNPPLPFLFFLFWHTLHWKAQVQHIINFSVLFSFFSTAQSEQWQSKKWRQSKAISSKCVLKLVINLLIVSLEWSPTGWRYDEDGRGILLCVNKKKKVYCRMRTHVTASCWLILKSR